MISRSVKRGKYPFIKCEKKPFSLPNFGTTFVLLRVKQLIFYTNYTKTILLSNQFSCFNIWLHVLNYSICFKMYRTHFFLLFHPLIINKLVLIAPGVSFLCLKWLPYHAAHKNERLNTIDSEYICNNSFSSIFRMKTKDSTVFN